MRTTLSVVIAVTMLAGCATGSPSRTASRDSSDKPAPTRCSPDDPDRWAWYCVIGQLLYGAADNLQPDPNLRFK